MNPRSEYPYGLRRPTEVERQQIVSQWKAGTNSGILWAFLLGALAMCAMCGFFSVASGENDLAGGIAVALLMTIFFMPFIVVWVYQIRRIGRRAMRLEKGEFLLTTAIALGATTNRATLSYVGFASVQLSDGRVWGKLSMPYKQASRAKRRKKYNFPVYLVQIEGEKKPMVFLR